MNVIHRKELEQIERPGRVVQRAVGDGGALPSEGLRIGFVRYQVGDRIAPAHRHDEEVIFVLAAESGTLHVGVGPDELTERVALERGMVIHIAAGEWHRVVTEGVVDLLYVHGRSI